MGSISIHFHSLGVLFGIGCTLVIFGTTFVIKHGMNVVFVFLIACLLLQKLGPDKSEHIPAVIV